MAPFELERDTIRTRAARRADPNIDFPDVLSRKRTDSMYPPPTMTTIALRPGRHKQERRQVTEIQRDRMIAAAMDAVAELGCANLTVAAVISRARVSRKTFYDVFVDREDCLLAAFEYTLENATVSVRDAYLNQPHWREGVQAALAYLLEIMGQEPGLARLWIIDTLSAGPRVLEHRSQVLDALVAGIDEGRRATNGDRQPPSVMGEGIVGGILAVLHTRLLSDSDEPLTDLFGPLMYMIALPYLGARKAADELRKPARSAPHRKANSRPMNADPLDDVPMRLTYRTIRVLDVIAMRPGVSNREVAEGADIVDQGQISKLLSRLARLGLLENRGEGQIKGAANSWHLTRRGADLVRGTHPSSRIPTSLHASG